MCIRDSGRSDGVPIFGTGDVAGAGRAVVAKHGFDRAISINEEKHLAGLALGRVVAGVASGSGDEVEDGADVTGAGVIDGD